MMQITKTNDAASRVSLPQIGEVQARRQCGYIDVYDGTRAEESISAALVPQTFAFWKQLGQWVSHSTKAGATVILVAAPPVGLVVAPVLLGAGEAIKELTKDS